MAVIGDPKGLKIPRRHDMLRPPTCGKAANDAKGFRINHCYAGGGMVRDISACQSTGGSGTDLSGSRLAVEVFGAADRGHRYESGLRMGLGAGWLAAKKEQDCDAAQL